MKLHINFFKSAHILRIAATLVSAIMIAFGMQGASPEKYAPNSILSSGKWVKIDISTPGLQTLSRQTLRNFGFSDPNSVYVYGYGGRMISEILSTEQPDDLPAVPVVRKDDGSITFYATGIISFQKPTTSEMAYDHVINPYSDNSYYFLSDVAPKEETPTSDMSDISGMPVTTSSVVQLVHERDLLQCAKSGRDYLGEDFKTTKSQNFNFELPDNVTGNARIRVKFGANTAGSVSSFIVSANGNRLPATDNDKIPAVTASDQYYTVTSSTKVAEGVGNSLNVGIEYSQAGVVSTARLDWIEVEYERALILRNTELYFQVRNLTSTAYTISGVSENTVVWDITEPWRIKEVKGSFDAAARTLTIGIRGNGIREFIAFDPTLTGASVAGRYKISNQDIHGMPTPDMVIITPEEFAASAERIANLHRKNEGMTVHVLAPEKIFNEFSSGNPDVSAFRKLLKMWYDRSQASPEGTQFGYCLLMGRPTYDQKAKNPETINSRYPRTLIWQSGTGLTEATSFCTDDFLAMLEDETSDRALSKRKQLIGVGRYTVTTSEEAEIAADKLEAYMTQPNYGIWRNNVLVIADDGDTANHLKQAESSIVNMMENESGAKYAYERIYLDAYERKQTGAGLTFPDAAERMLAKWQKEGVALINYIGHANPKEWAHEKLLTWNDINSMSNQNLPILYAATCSFGKWDEEEISGAEIMLTNPAGGAIAVITPSRTVYISQNGNLTNSISKEFFRRDSLGNSQRLGDIIRLGKNGNATPDLNMLRYHLFGDPALKVPVPQFSVLIDSIAGQPIADNIEDAPSLSARSSVRIAGRIADIQGNTTDFNGPLQFVLFDAEKSVETHGWGTAGEVSVYQDRSSKLATGSTIVTDGRWSTNILMPSEITNNYSPALINLYAYDPTNKIEAHGATDRLYVYGYDESAAHDDEGPVIESFAISSNASGNSSVVHANPVAIAVFGDESGINISNAGIGHKMCLTLDSKKVFDDVCLYFVPDPEEETKGSIAYPLHDLEPGDHELTLTVWDNARNSSTSTINFKVGVNKHPDVMQILSVYDRENDQLKVKVTTDRALCTLGCKLECFDLNGALLWSSDRKAYSGSDSSVSYAWNLNDSNGLRLPRGIYMLRTSITTEDGLTTTKSKKIAIPAK